MRPHVKCQCFSKSAEKRSPGTQVERERAALFQSQTDQSGIFQKVAL